MKINVLVFPCGSEIGLEIHNALKYAINHVELIGGTSVHDHGEYVYKNVIRDIPFVKSPEFIPSLNRIIKENNIDFVYPAHDDVIVALAEAKDELICPAIVPNIKTANICRSKKVAYDLFKDKINTPRVYANIDEIDQYPVFLKPDIGQGSKGTMKANSKEDVINAIEKDPTLLILEFLPGDEFTIDCFTDRKGQLLFSGARQRVRTSNGISVNSKSIINPEFTKIAEIINKELKLQGAWFFQMKYDAHNNLSLLEIAPRIAGTMSFFRNLGVNFPLLTLFDRKGLDITIAPNQHHLELDRALITRFKTDLTYKTVYIDLDDCLLLKDTINTQLISFIFQCLNEEKNIKLITKHIEDIDKTLSKYRIKQLFDEIIHLEKKDDKTKYMKEKDAIYIDDSHSERINVMRKLHIPTFAPDAIESLIDWHK